MYTKRLAVGTKVRVIQDIHQSGTAYGAETVGVIDAWDGEPTGAWFAHGRNGRLWLQRLRLRKPDGEVSLLTIDDRTRVQPIGSNGKQEHNPIPPNP